MKEYIKASIATLFFVGMIISCTDEYLDINENPNAAVNVDPDYLFGYASAAWSGSRTGGDTFLPIGFANQSLATGGNYGWGYGGDRYDISPYSIGNTWRFYFVNGGLNLKRAIELAENSNPINNNAASQAKVLLANMIYEATMIYGDIPYTEAWNEDIDEPVFDSQESVLENVLILLDEALSNFDSNSILKISSNDIYFQGDIDKWIKYAKSLKLKILMTMVDKKPEKANDIANLINAGGMISSSSDNVLFKFADAADNQNPKYKLFSKYAGGQNPWIFANDNVFYFMEELDDPRIPIYFDEGTDASEGEYISVATATEADGKTSVINLEKLWAADASDIIFSYQEQLLFEAEIYARGIGVAYDLSVANTKFRKGVSEAMKYYGVSESEINTFLENNLPNISTLTQEEAIRQIHIQQWIDLMDRSLEAWVQSRRSGVEGQEVPTLLLPIGAPAGGIMRRWNYAPDELTANSNSPTSNFPIYEKMWFDL